MRHRVSSLTLRLWLTTAAVLFAATAFAQQPVSLSDAATTQATTISIPNHTAEIDGLLQRGYKMEVERRWSDALTHYEEAMRAFPDDPGLQRRFELTRLHYDLGRRYLDRSFLGSLVSLSPEKALELYNQVLLKIQSHHVDAPHWQSVVECGTYDLEVALSEPAFVRRNLRQQSPEAVEEFRNELRQTLRKLAVHSREDARNAAAVASRLAEQRLGIDPTAVVLEYLCGATNTLDPYSAYLTPAQLSEVYSQIEGNFVGLGIELKADGETLRIVRVIPKSPADEGGMRAGDQIVSVDGQPTKDLSTDQAANLLQGVEGSIVELVVTAPSELPRQLSIRRRRVEVPSIDNARIIDRENGVAYLQLVCFQKTTCRDLDTALWDLHRQGMRRLIMDLRGNPGGLLVTAVEVSDRFVERGIIVSTRGRSVQEDFTYSAHIAGTWRVPLVVLIDRDSASAAEIFAGAIRDHRRGTIVGARSYGKGSVQGIFPLGISEAGIRLTTAKFYSPNGRAYSRVGVEPDVVVHQTARPADGRVVLKNDSEDVVLAAAIETARRLGQKR